MTIKHFETADLSLATTLSLYFPIESTKPVDNKKVLFIFQKSQELDDLIGTYWRGELRIEPQKFFSQLKVIKTRIYSQT